MSSQSDAPLQGTTPDILVVEPFYCGSHKQLVDCLMGDAAIGPRTHLVTMSGKKWHWRARVSALHLSTAIPVNQNFRILFSSSVLNLAELIALRPDLAALHKVLYFHENQLQYPVRKQKDRDFQYGYNQIMSCLAADCVLFNSRFNMESFLTSITSFLKLIPDYRPKGLADNIRPKCSVLYFPMVYKNIDLCLHNEAEDQPTLNTSDVPRAQQTSSRHCPHNAHEKVGSNLQTHQLNTCYDPSVQQCPAASSDRHSELQNSFVCCCHDHRVQDPRAQLLQRDYCDNRITQTECFFHKDTGEEKADCSECDRKMFSLQSHLPRVSSGIDCPSSSGFTMSRGNHSRTLPSEDVKLPVRKWEDYIHIVWPHRWEHDKDPETFFQVLYRLHDEGSPFVVSVLGETFTDVPGIFAEAKEKLADHIYAWGFQTKKATYYNVLKTADVVVSTSKHEFFGVAVLEAVYLGCYPLCPKALVYPEIYPEECLYSTPVQLYKRLRGFCRHPHQARASSVQVDVHKFSWCNIRHEYLSKLKIHEQR